MLDRGRFWTPAPEPDAGLAIAGLRVTAVTGLRQCLISGDPHAIGGLLPGGSPRPVGFNDVALGNPYAAAIARDRTLIVGDRAVDVAEGWHAGLGIAATIMDDAWTVLDIQGDGLDDLLSMATTIDPGERTRSCALLFASVPCLAYRYRSASASRVHVERPFAPYLLEWIRRVMEDGSARQPQDQRWADRPVKELPT